MIARPRLILQFICLVTHSLNPPLVKIQGEGLFLAGRLIIWLTALSGLLIVHLPRQMMGGDFQMRKSLPLPRFIEIIISWKIVVYWRTSRIRGSSSCGQQTIARLWGGPSSFVSRILLLQSLRRSGLWRCRGTLLLVSRVSPLIYFPLDRLWRISSWILMIALHLPRPACGRRSSPNSCHLWAPGPGDTLASRGIKFLRSFCFLLALPNLGSQPFNNTSWSHVTFTSEIEEAETALRTLLEAGVWREWWQKVACSMRIPKYFRQVEVLPFLYGKSQDSNDDM